MESTVGWNRDALAEGVTVRFLGASPRIEALRGAIAKVARAHAPVLITGEIGTGKELVARLIHQHSDRAIGPFVSVSGAAVTPEFFPPAPRPGAAGNPTRSAVDIGAVNGGTLFIHEVGDLSTEAQTALLLYLQQSDGEGHAPLARLLSSTHADLERQSHAGEFREDLFYRMASMHLDVPPLRGRGPDVALLARHFLNDFSGARDLQFDDDAQRQLTTHAWPGNVRELRNRVLQASMMCDGTHLTAELLGLSEVTRFARKSRGGMSLRETRHIAEREAITQALRESHGQVPAAAASLGISRAQLYRLIGRLHVDHHLDYEIN